MANPLYGANKDGGGLDEARKSFTNRVHLMNTATQSLDISHETEGDKIVLITAAMADDTYLRLPEATTSNGGMHIQVILGIALADAFKVGFVTSKIIGGATAMGDTNEAVGGAADHGSAIADVGDAFLSVVFDIDAAATAGGTGGTKLDFYYTGQSNLVVYSGNLISEIDAPTLTGHFSTTAANA